MYLICIETGGGEAVKNVVQSGFGTGIPSDVIILVFFSQYRNNSHAGLVIGSGEHENSVNIQNISRRKQW
jgi:hypothetical protein